MTSSLRAETASLLGVVVLLIFYCNLNVTGLTVEDGKATNFRSFFHEYITRQGKKMWFGHFNDVCENFAVNMYSTCKSTGGPFDIDWGDGAWDNMGTLDEDRAAPVKPPLAQMWQSPPDSLDWRTYNVVSPVKSQGYCDAASAYFAADAGAESSVALFHNGKQIDLSEQAIIDCSYHRYGQWNAGCHGANLEATLNYLTQTFIYENEYPYVSGRTQTHYQCKYPNPIRKERLKGFWPVRPAGDEDALKTAASYGPVVVAICTNRKFQKYGGGIFEDSSCKEENYGTLVVGYGQESGKDFWIVKCSFGTSWGKQGYIRIGRNSGNMLGIANQAYFLNA